MMVDQVKAETAQNSPSPASKEARGMESQFAAPLAYHYGSITVTAQDREEYRRRLRNARENGKSEPLPNLRPWQCKMAVEELVMLAKTLQADARKTGTSVCIRILTGVCPGHVYGNADFRTFLSDGGEIKILVWNENSSVSNPLKILSDIYPKQVHFVYARQPIQSAPINHFLVVGKNAYRLEAIHEKSTIFTDMEPTIPARINFNDPEGAARLVDGFDSLWSLFSIAHSHVQSAGQP
jgi:hypothetical protein